MRLEIKRAVPQYCERLFWFLLCMVLFSQGPEMENLRGQNEPAALCAAGFFMYLYQLLPFLAYYLLISMLIANFHWLKIDL